MHYVAHCPLAGVATNTSHLLLANTFKTPVLASRQIVAVDNWTYLLSPKGYCSLDLSVTMNSNYHNMRLFVCLVFDNDFNLLST